MRNRDRILAGLLLGGLVASASVVAATAVPDEPGVPSLRAGLALAGQRQCLACHQVDSQRVGPPFRAIARRFAGQPAAARYLAGVIRSGSSGQWGAIPMPAQTRVSPDDAERLARWILSLDSH